jgi:antigen flippase
MTAAGPAAQFTAEKPQPSYNRVLKASSIIGGSSVIVMLIRAIRTKILAVFLGPGGVGLEAVIDSVVSLTRMIFDMGLGSSGVRQIAAAASSGNEEVIAKTTATLRRACLVLGTLGAAALFYARETVSRVAFGDVAQASNIGFLAIILVCGAVAGGQGALLTGMQRIGELAWANIWGTLIGAAISIPIVMLLGKDGIALYMVLTSGAGLLVSWMYVRRIRLPAVKLGKREGVQEAVVLLRLGLAFVATTVMATGTMFILRVLVTRTEGIEAAGQFQAANALSMVVVGFILQAMGTDFFPRLTAVADDNIHCNQLVNEQTEISFLLALPGVLGTLALSPWVIRALYTSQFAAAGDILAWQMAGMFLRLASWPMGYILMAKGRGIAFVLTDAAAWVVYILLAVVGLKLFGLPGIGMAFLGLYTFYVILIYSVVQSTSGFLWSGRNKRLLVVGVVTIAVALGARLLLRDPWASLLGVMLTVSTGVYCAQMLAAVIGREVVVNKIRRLCLPCWNRLSARRPVGSRKEL